MPSPTAPIRKQVVEGESRGESADKNDLLAFALPPNHDYIMRVGKPVRLEKKFKTTTDKEQTLEVELPAEDKKEPAEKPGLTKSKRNRSGRKRAASSSGNEEKRAKLDVRPEVDLLLPDHEAAVRQPSLEGVSGLADHGQAEKRFRGQGGPVQGLRQPVVVREVGEAEEGLAVGHRHARRRRGAEACQRQPVADHAAVLQGPPRGLRVQIPGFAGAQ